MIRKLPVLLTVGLLTAACSTSPDGADAVVESSTLASSRCSGAFVAHELAHITQGARRTTTMFDGTGAGVAVADLDADGRLDIVMANLTGATHVFWNRGDLDFARTELIEGRFRQVSAVDVDGDDAVDIVLSTGIGRPVVLRNTGDGSFVRTTLDGVEAATYSMAWGDLGGDGDLDLVTGSYNAELTASRDFSSVLGGHNGVFVHEAIDGGGYVSTELTREAQALAILLHDVDEDGLADIVVGNDLLTPDATWSFRDDAWVHLQPFSQTTFSTMSLDVGDLDNDGDFDILATDMHPMTDDPAVLEAWAPVMEDMEAQPVLPDDRQVMANVLQIADGDFENRAGDFGVTATGWSWSGLFGDLDNDGLLDVYVVNGMAADSLFPNLPDHTLVEENQAFRNVDGSDLVPAPEWGLAATEGGRGMAMADLDDDGDLDIVINNLGAPARIFENQLCSGDGITVDLRWDGTGNQAAIGSTVIADTPAGTQMRGVSAARGYLSGGPTRVHIGVGDAAIVDMEVMWPDGVRSDVGSVEAGTRVVITRVGAP